MRKRQHFGSHILGSSLHPVALLIGFEVNCDVCPSFVSSTPDQAADDHVKIKITKYKTGSSPGGEVKVQEMGEGDPQWKHIKDVVKEQLEKAGLKAEGMRGSTPNTRCLFSLPSVISSIALCASLLTFVN